MGNRKRFELSDVRVIESKVIWKMTRKEMKISLSYREHEVRVDEGSCYWQSTVAEQLG